MTFPGAAVIIGLRDHMTQQMLIQNFLQFGLAGLLGVLIGLEREMSGQKNGSMGGRDFVLFSLIGATTAFAALRYELPWLLPLAFTAVLLLVMSRYWKDKDQGPGITTELAATLTFVLGVLVMHGAREIAIALAIVALALLAHKRAIKKFGARLKQRDLNATLKLLVISFIILPVLPHESLDSYLWFEIGTIERVEVSSGQVRIKPTDGQPPAIGDKVTVDPEAGGHPVEVSIVQKGADYLIGRVPNGKAGSLTAGSGVYDSLGIEFVNVALSAIKPYTLWLIIILVSLISFVGYILMKLMGSAAGVGLTGVLGGLISSTVTTLSFARRSVERPELNRAVGVAILLASAMMFPRLLLEMFVVNRELAASVAFPLVLMSITGFALALWFYLRSMHMTEAGKGRSVEFENPFSLTAAVTFGLVFAGILILTRTATHYLGDAWLPAVALVSGLTDADAIAFSISDAHSSELISLRWASFNLVLGAISNTLMKLGLVLFLGNRGLFRYLVLPYAVITAVGLVTIVLYYGILPG